MFFWTKKGPKRVHEIQNTYCGIHGNKNRNLKTGNKIDTPNKEIISSTLINHINELHLFYGEHMGSRIARKHVGWYIDANLHQPQIKKEFNKIMLAPEQINFLESKLMAAMD